MYATLELSRSCFTSNASDNVNTVAKMQGHYDHIGGTTHTTLWASWFVVNIVTCIGKLNG